MNEKFGDIIFDILKNYHSIQEKFNSFESEGRSVTNYVRKNIRDVNEYIMKINQEYGSSIYYKSFDIIMEKIADLSKKLNLENVDEMFQDSKNFISTYKEYLDNEDETYIEEIVEYLSKWIILSNYCKDLSSKIGETTLKKAIVLTLTHTVKVNKVIYQFAKGTIDKIKARSEILKLNNIYTLQIINFIKDEISIQEFIPEIIDLFQGKHFKAIFSTVMKVTSKVMKKYSINKSIDEMIDNKKNSKNFTSLIEEGRKYEEHNND